MKERPILFSAPMVRALLDGTKTQTRRVVKITHRTPGLAACLAPPAGMRTRTSLAAELCPHGQPGDRLWVREAWRTVAAADALPPRDLTPAHRIWYETDTSLSAWRGLAELGKLRPGMFMPRWASRITLEVSGVRVERLQDISRDDAIAEGVRPLVGSDGPNHWTVATEFGSLNAPTPQHCYELLWNWINGPESWSANPWVWVVEFKRLEATHG